jgi:hypothetical protein
VSPRALSLAAAASVAAAVFMGGCTVGEGTGSATGTLRDVGCNASNSLMTAQPYTLLPQFFAGEPIEDVCPLMGGCSGPRTNRLIIRMQHTGNGVEVNDTLYFDVHDSYKVAQCVRGQTIGGVPNWDLRNITAADGSPIPGVPWCDWNVATFDGGQADAGTDAGNLDGGARPPFVMTAMRARINLSTQDYVQASLAPLYSCVEARSVAVALPGSWIEFQDFGLAAQPAVPPDQRQTVGDDFDVAFGQHLSATFHLILGDQAVEYAIKTNAFVPDPQIGGTLDGFFDFTLDRGRAAQAFP